MDAKRSEQQIPGTGPVAQQAQTMWHRSKQGFPGVAIAATLISLALAVCPGSELVRFYALVAVFGTAVVFICWMCIPVWSLWRQRSTQFSQPTLKYRSHSIYVAKPDDIDWIAGWVFLPKPPFGYIPGVTQLSPVGLGPGPILE